MFIIFSRTGLPGTGEVLPQHVQPKRASIYALAVSRRQSLASSSWSRSVSESHFFSFRRVEQTGVLGSEMSYNEVISAKRCDFSADIHILHMESDVIRAICAIKSNQTRGTRWIERISASWTSSDPYIEQRLIALPRTTGKRLDVHACPDLEWIDILALMRTGRCLVLLSSCSALQQ